MTNRKITHEVKLQKSVIVILAVLAIGVLANAFGPALNVKSALAALAGGSGDYPFHVDLNGGHGSSPFRIELTCRGCK